MKPAPRHWYVVSQRGTLTKVDTVKATSGIQAKKTVSENTNIPFGALVVRMARGDEAILVEGQHAKAT